MKTIKLSFFVNHEGLGVGRIGNFTIFVFGALPNEVAIVKLIKIQRIMDMEN